MPPRSALRWLAVLGLVGSILWVGTGLLRGDGEGGGVAPATALALGGDQDTWVPGQPALTEDPFFLQILGSALASAEDRWTARERLLDEIERRRKRAEERARRRAQREAERRRRAQLRALERLRRQRERALREARARYQEALRKAAAEKRRRERELAEQRKALRDKRRALERKRRIDPGEECQFESVQAQYDCERGRL